MAEIEVYRNGRLLKRVERPVHDTAQGREVTFRGQRYVLRGSRIDLDAVRETAAAIRHADAGAAREPDRLCATPRATRTPPAGAPSAARAETWDPDQRAVIDEAPNARLLVEAGPGTGKTAVACARVASLIRRGVEPEKVWLISFTRTAVREIRDRIAALVHDESRAGAVRITTLDSHAWQLRQGFDPLAEGSPFRGYEATIADVIALLRKGDEAITEYFAELEHLVVDEAQDLVGSRAELTLLIIRSLPRSTGVTVFSDSAQAIYGFTDDEADEQGNQGGTLPAIVKAEGSLGFRQAELRTVHRTRSESLRTIFEHTRQLVLHVGAEQEQGLERIVEDVKRRCDGTVGGQIEEQGLEGRSDILVLYRRRAEVLIASSYLNNSGTTHRIRMSGTPTCIHPWIGQVFSDRVTGTLSRSEFADLWAERLGSVPDGEPSAEGAWSLLHRACGRPGDRIDLTDLRVKLSRSQPPIEMCSPDLGVSGPILGTIHASKGREAEIVHLMLGSFQPNGRAIDEVEEGRVVFVGATRARLELKVGAAAGSRCFKLSSGRVGRWPWSRNGKRAAGPQVEVGRAGDLDERAQVSRRFIEDPATARALQGWLANLEDRPVNVTAHQLPEAEYTYALRDAAGKPCGWLSRQLNFDLMELGHKPTPNGRPQRRRPPNYIKNIFVVGCRTVVLGPDDPDLGDLHEPYSHSGIFLVPVIVGIPLVPLFRYSGA